MQKPEDPPKPKPAGPARPDDATEKRGDERPREKTGAPKPQTPEKPGGR